MRFALAALGFINKDVDHNKEIIISTIKKYKDCADMIVFGEAFLQGFYAFTFSYEDDYKIALGIEDSIIKEICEACNKYNTALSFGFLEKDCNRLFSSQLTIDENGNILNVFRRVSPGWKESFANEKYLEGENFKSFNFKDKTLSVGLCGDLWFDENIEKIKSLDPDILLWPVYTDYNFKEWNEEVKFEYLERASLLSCAVFYVNSYCIDKENEKDIAKGGAAAFVFNEIMDEIPSGYEGVLLVEI